MPQHPRQTPSARRPKPLRTFSRDKRQPITINVAECQIELCRRLCVHHGEPGVPLASMAATAFTRGLALLHQEITAGSIVLPITEDL